MGVAAYSLNYGKNWTFFPTYPVPNNYYLGGIVAIASDGSKIVWQPFQATPYYTEDLGQTWKSSTGAPINDDACCNAYKPPRLGLDSGYNLRLVADCENPTKFYIYSEGKFYRTDDGSATWKVVSTFPISSKINHVYLQTAPDREGEIWISLESEGLWRSSDSGNSFSKVSAFSSAMLVSFGKNPPDKTVPTVFVMGTYSKDFGVWRSDDFGISWIRANSDEVPLGDNPWTLEGDKAVYGRVYVGTLGRGVFVGDMA